MDHQENMHQHSSGIFSPFSFEIASTSDPNHPERNEDYLEVVPQSGLAVLCDGVGSAVGAEKAGYLAAKKIQSCLTDILAQPLDPSNAPVQSKTVHYLLEQANQEVLALGERLTEQHGKKEHAATTIVLALFSHQPANDRMAYGHVGDSRIYLQRKGEPLRRLTTDDGYFLHAQNKGYLDEQSALRIEQANSREELSAEEFEHFSKRHGILQALGDKNPNFHSGELDLLSGDRILLCCDGVHDNLTDKEIETILSQEAGTAAVKLLVQRAYARSLESENGNMRSKKDDISAIIIARQ